MRLLVAGNSTFEELGPLAREVAIGLLRQPIPVSEGFPEDAVPLEVADRSEARTHQQSVSFPQPPRPHHRRRNASWHICLNLFNRDRKFRRSFGLRPRNWNSPRDGYSIFVSPQKT